MTTPSDATNVAGYKWELLDSSTAETGTEVGTTSSLSILQNMIGKFVKITVTDADGKTFSAISQAAVTKDNTASVALADAYGLQSNGTGLVDDVLVVSYGSALGTPQSVTWYYNDTVVKAYTNQAGNLTEALNLPTGANADATYVTATNPALANCKAGNYYVVIVNTAGESFTSNTLSLVYDEEAAVTTSATFSDDLTNKVSGNLVYSPNDTRAVVTIKTPKAYRGTYYIYEEDVTNYTSTNCVDSFAYPAGGLAAAPTADKLTETNAIAGTYRQYTSEAGETTIMIPINAFTKTTSYLTRGKKYKVVFDQFNVKDDDIGTTGRKDVKATEAAEVAYLAAPAKIELVSVAKGTAATAQLLDAEGNVLSYIGDSTKTKVADQTTYTAAGFDSVVVYGNTSATASTNMAAQNGVFKNGVWTSNDPTTGLKDYNYYQAVAKTTEGVYGEKSITLTSEFKAQNIALASEVKVAENSTTAAQADITLKGVVANSKVYVVCAYDSTDAGGKGAFDPTDSSTYRGVAEVTPGQGTATVSGVFKKTDIGRSFTAYLVPDDTQTYARVASEAMTLNQTATSIEYASAGTGFTQLGGDPDALTTTAANPDGFTGGTTILVKDQFGTTIDGTGSFTALTGKAATVTPVNAGGVWTEAATATYDVSATGALTVNILRSTGVDYKDGFKVNVLGSDIEFTAATPQGLAVNATTNPYTIKMGTTTLVDGVVPAALTAGIIGTSANDTTNNTGLLLVECMNAANADESNTTPVATTITTIAYTFTVPAGQAGTLGANDTLAGNNGKAMTNNGELTLKGTVTTWATAGDTIGTGKYILAGTSAVNQTNLTLLGTTLTSAATLEIASNITSTAGAALNMDADGSIIIAKGVTVDTDDDAWKFSAPLTINGTLKDTKAGAVEASKGIKVTSTGSININATGAFVVGDGETVEIAPEATITELVFGAKTAATGRNVLSDGTYKNTFGATGTGDVTSGIINEANGTKTMADSKKITVTRSTAAETLGLLAYTIA